MALIEKDTSRLGLPLPNQDNFLQDDCARLVKALETLDEVTATVDASGKLDKAQVPDNVPTIDPVTGFIASALLGTDIPKKDKQGKILVTDLPAQSMATVFEASFESAMLKPAATVNLGDICHRLDTNQYFILVNADPSMRDNWRELPATAVSSVNGKTGAITGLAASGANNDITSLDGLVGPLTLKSAGQGEYDAATLGQVKTMIATSGGGGGGANMSGVMNNFIGAVEWFNGTRAQLPAGYVAADGQLVSRTDAETADLWAAVKSGFLNSVNDTAWLGDLKNDPEGFGKNRAMYSLGYKAGGVTPGTADDGESFRMPDLNGSKVYGKDGWAYGTSSPALHLRGDTYGDAGSVTAGTVIRNAAPNITGAWSDRRIGSAAPGGDNTYTNTAQGKAVSITRSTGTKLVLLSNPTGANAAAPADEITFDASRSAGSYGRDHTSEVRPNSAAGIWIIRANGNFSSGRTEFSVIDGNAALPASGTNVFGGKLISRYNAAGKSYVHADFQGGALLGQYAYASVSTHIDDSGISKEWFFRSDGLLETPGHIHVCPPALNGTVQDDTTRIGLVMADTRFNGRPTTGHQGGQFWSRVMNAVPTGDAIIWQFGAYVQADITVPGVQEESYGVVTLQPTGGINRWWKFANDGAAVAMSNVSPNGGWQTLSDERIKTGIKRVGNALKAVNSWRGATWNWRNNPAKRGFGLIAQDIENTDPELVGRQGKVTLDDGSVIDDVRSIDNGMISAAYHTEAIRELVQLVKLAITDPAKALETLAEIES